MLQSISSSAIPSAIPKSHSEAEYDVMTYYDDLFDSEFYWEHVGGLCLQHASNETTDEGIDMGLLGVFDQIKAEFRNVHKVTNFIRTHQKELRKIMPSNEAIELTFPAQNGIKSSELCFDHFHTLMRI